MLRELTTEQAEKLARGWAWIPWQQAVNSAGARWRIEDTDGPTLRQLRVNGYGPDLDDDVTRDGLLRTCRSMWQDESLHVVPTCGFAITKHFLRRVGIDKHGQKEMQVWYGESFDRPPGDGIPLAGLYDSEKEALLAAILAAPEAT
jgi:hypothetical protein